MSDSGKAPEKPPVEQPSTTLRDDADGPAHKESRSSSLARDILSGTWLVSVLAVVVALVLGAILIAFSDPRVQETASYIFARPSDFFGAVWDKVSAAYSALFRGAIFDWQANSPTRAIRPLTESLVNATPLILAGLAVAIPFRAGMFNIGAQGQVIIGTLFAGYIGYAMQLPVVLHLLLALIGGILGGALYGGIAGLLKAKTGANEVIVTIMLNYVAALFAGWTVYAGGTQGQRPGPLWDPTAGAISETADVLASARSARHSGSISASSRSSRPSSCGGSWSVRPLASSSAPRARTQAQHAPRASRSTRS